MMSRSPVSSSAQDSDFEAKGSTYRVLFSHYIGKSLSGSELEKYMDTYWSGVNDQLGWSVRHRVTASPRMRPCGQRRWSPLAHRGQNGRLGEYLLVTSPIRGP
jgi:hypothetical protein